MITLEAFQSEINTWDNLKFYLEGFPPNQVAGLTGSFSLHPMALYLRLKFQDETVLIDRVLCSMSGHELLTPIWLREYSLLFTGKTEQELQTVDVCLTLLNRIIEEQTPKTDLNAEEKADLVRRYSVELKQEAERLAMLSEQYPYEWDYLEYNFQSVTSHYNQLIKIFSESTTPAVSDNS